MEGLKTELTKNIISIGKYAPNSVCTIVNALMNIICNLWGYNNFTWEKFNETDVVIKYLDLIPNDNTRKNRASAAKIYTNFCNYGFTAEVKNVYINYFNKIAQRIDAIRLGHSDNLTAKDLEIKKDWTDIRNKIKEYEVNKDKNLDSYMKYYIGSLYTCHPPLRPGEWASSIFSDIDDGITNHINIKEGRMKIYQQKSKTHQVREFKLSPKLIKIMIVFRHKIEQSFGPRPIEYVVPSCRYGYTSTNANNLSKQIVSIFNMNCDTLRHIYESTIISIGPDTRIYVAKVMGHTLETQATDYAIYGKFENKPENGDPFDLIENKMHT